MVHFFAFLVDFLQKHCIFNAMKINKHEVYKSVRKTWGELSPVTRRLESRKRYNRNEKHRKQFAEVD